MDKKKIKRIIAREGIILLIVVITGTLGFLWVWFTKDILIYYTTLELWRNWLLLIAIPFYTIYILIRFIIWAVRTLREEK